MIWRHLRWSLYRNKIFGSPCPLWCRSPWRSTDGILHQRRTRYNRLFAYKLPHSPFLYWRAESWKSHQWNWWINAECIFKPKRWEKKGTQVFGRDLFCLRIMLWQWLQSFKKKTYIYRPIFQWLYYGFWFSAFCVFHKFHKSNTYIIAANIT